MDKEIDILRLRLIIRGALDCLRHDSIAINEALTAQGKRSITASCFITLWCLILHHLR